MTIKAQHTCVLQPVSAGQDIRSSGSSSADVLDVGVCVLQDGSSTTGVAECWPKHRTTWASPATGTEHASIQLQASAAVVKPAGQAVHSVASATLE
jgi:hypothetical protein